MADRRMFSKQIIDSDAFIDLPVGAKLLYYDLGVRADDDGFVNSPKKVMRISGATQEDFNILVERKFILEFESGVIAIKHWFIHNNIRKDRYHATNYKEEKAQLSFDENNAYTRTPQPKTEKTENSATKNQDLDNQKTEKPENVATKKAVEPTEVRLGKDSIGKDNNILTGNRECNGNNRDSLELEKGVTNNDRRGDGEKVGGTESTARREPEEGTVEYYEHFGWKAEGTGEG